MKQRYAYGTDPNQYAELYLPQERLFGGVAVVVHGGYWRSLYAADLGEPLAKDLAAHGIVAWNLEYRRAGNGGGWPETFEDIAAGIDKLAEAAGEHGLDLSKVVALGHSAGGHLAVWAAGRDKLPPGAPGAPDHPAASGRPAMVALTAVVSQSGLLDLQEARALNLSNGAVLNFLGSTPEASPERYWLADPRQQLPLNVPVYAVYGDTDTSVPPSQSRDYVSASESACRSDSVAARLISVPGDHFDLIDVRSQAYATCRELVAQSLVELPRA